MCRTRRLARTKQAITKAPRTAPTHFFQENEPGVFACGKEGGDRRRKMAMGLRSAGIVDKTILRG